MSSARDAVGAAAGNTGRARRPCDVELGPRPEELVLVDAAKAAGRLALLLLLLVLMLLLLLLVGTVVGLRRLLLLVLVLLMLLLLGRQPREVLRQLVRQRRVLGKGRVRHRGRVAVELD